MSAWSLLDLFSADILSETRFEPWWEKLRSYCMRGLFGILPFVFYYTNVAKPINCISTHRTNVTLSAPEVLLINWHCYAQLDPIIRYSGVIALSASLILFLLCRFWLMIPSVINAFRTIRQVDDMIDKSDLGRTDIEKLVFFPRKNKDDKGDIGSACWKIFHHDPGRVSIPTLYHVRNILVSIFLVSYITICCIHFEIEMRGKTTFGCQADNEVKSVIGLDEYMCSNELRQMLRPYALSYAVLCFLMFISLLGYSLPLIVTVWKRLWHKCCAAPSPGNPESDRLVERKCLDLERDYEFIEFFSEHSQRIHTSTKTLLTVASVNAMKIMAEQGLPQAIECWDRDYIKLFLLLHSDGKRHLIEKLREAEPWLKDDYHDHVFDMSHIFEIAMEKGDFDLVCKLHHGLFFKKSKEGPRQRSKIGFEFTGCGCFKRQWSLARKNEERAPCRNEMRKGRHADEENVHLQLEEMTPDAFTLLNYICKKCYDGTFDPVMTRHFMYYSSAEGLSSATKTHVNGKTITEWLGECKEVGNKCEGWNEMLSVLSEYHVITSEDKVNLINRSSQTTNIRGARISVQVVNPRHF